jgi:hypothetical protein
MLLDLGRRVPHSPTGHRTRVLGLGRDPGRHFPTRAHEEIRRLASPRALMPGPVPTSLREKSDGQKSSENHSINPHSPHTVLTRPSAKSNGYVEDCEEREIC